MNFPALKFFLNPKVYTISNFSSFVPIQFLKLVYTRKRPRVQSMLLYSFLVSVSKFQSLLLLLDHNNASPERESEKQTWFTQLAQIKLSIDACVKHNREIRTALELEADTEELQLIVRASENTTQTFGYFYAADLDRIRYVKEELAQNQDLLRAVYEARVRDSPPLHQPLRAPTPVADADMDTTMVATRADLKPRKRKRDDSGNPTTTTYYTYLRMLNTDLMTQLVNFSTASRLVDVLYLIKNTDVRDYATQYSIAERFRLNATDPNTIRPWSLAETQELVVLCCRRHLFYVLYLIHGGPFDCHVIYNFLMDHVPETTSLALEAVRGLDFATMDPGMFKWLMHLFLQSRAMEVVMFLMRGPWRSRVLQYIYDRYNLLRASTVRDIALSAEADGLLTAMLELSDADTLKTHPWSLVLTIRAGRGLWSAVEIMLHYGIDPNVPDGTREAFTPLHYAIADVRSEDRDRMIRLLLAKGANPNAYDTQSRSEFAYYMSVPTQNPPRNLKTVDAFLDAGLRLHSVVSSAIYAACTSGSKEVVQRVVARGADLNAVEPGRRNSPLFYAVASGNEELITWLLDQGADIHHTNGSGRNALFYIPMKTNIRRILELLLERGADLNRADQHGTTFAHWMSARSEVDFNHWFFICYPKIADINARSATEETLLVLAIGRGDHVITKTIVQHPKLDATALIYGKTAAYYAQQHVTSHRTSVDARPCWTAITSDLKRLYTQQKASLRKQQRKRQADADADADELF